MGLLSARCPLLWSFDAKKFPLRLQRHVSTKTSNVSMCAIEWVFSLTAQAAGQTDDMMFNLEVDGEVAPAAAAKVSSSIEISSGPHLTSCNPIGKIF